MSLCSGSVKKQTSEILVRKRIQIRELLSAKEILYTHFNFSYSFESVSSHFLVSHVFSYCFTPCSQYIHHCSAPCTVYKSPAQDERKRDVRGVCMCLNRYRTHRRTHTIKIAIVFLTRQYNSVYDVRIEHKWFVLTTVERCRRRHENRAQSHCFIRERKHKTGIHHFFFHSFRRTWRLAEDIVQQSGITNECHHRHQAIAVFSRNFSNATSTFRAESSLTRSTHGTRDCVGLVRV